MNQKIKTMIKLGKLKSLNTFFFQKYFPMICIHIFHFETFSILFNSTVKVLRIVNK